MPKELYMCQLCANHGKFDQPKKGHKEMCPHRNCICHLCALNTKRRALDQIERHLRGSHGNDETAVSYKNKINTSTVNLQSSKDSFRKLKGLNEFNKPISFNQFVKDTSALETKSFLYSTTVIRNIQSNNSQQISNLIMNNLNVIKPPFYQNKVKNAHKKREENILKINKNNNNCCFQKKIKKSNDKDMIAVGRRLPVRLTEEKNYSVHQHQTAKKRLQNLIFPFDLSKNQQSKEKCFSISSNFHEFCSIDLLLSNK